MSTIVYYHDNCTDGFAAAYAVYKAIGLKDVEYVPCNYGGSLPSEEEYKSKKVIIVDFSFPLEVMNDMQKQCIHFTWLDHHKTAFEMYGLPSNVLYVNQTDKTDIVLDPNRSGALIAVEWFTDKLKNHWTTNQVLSLIHFIDDRDRWQFKLPMTKEVHAALQLIKPWSFEQWDMLEQDFLSDHGFASFVQSGSTALKVQNAQVLSSSKKSFKCFISYENDKEQIVRTSGLAVNSTVHMSEIGHELCKQSKSYGLVYYVDEQGTVKCSLRSEGDYDVSVIAKHFGGGGHKNAAGFSVSVKQLMHFLGKPL